MESLYDVIIIGGGVTGLSAAETLVKSGKFERILILEAQNRFGGRTCTVSSKIEEDTVDIGGQWVGPTQTKVLRLLDRFGIERIEQDFSPEIELITGEKRPRFVEMIHINLIPLTDSEQLEILAFENHIEELCKEMDLEKPWLLQNAQEFDKLSVADYIEENVKLAAAKSELLLFCQGMVSSDPKDCSFLFFIFFVASGGGVESLGDGPNGMQKWKLKGGAQQISEYYAKEIQSLGVFVRQSCPVRTIEKIEDSRFFSITCDNKVENEGENETQKLVLSAKHVIIAMSPALALKKISFGDNIIQPEKKKLYSSMLPGRAVKIILSYETEFWHSDKTNRRPIDVQELSKFIVHNIFTSTVGKYPALIGLITGDAAERYTKLTLEKGVDVARAEVYKQLSFMYGCTLDVACNPVEIFEKNWCLEEYAYGCYAGFFPPLSLTTYGTHMRTSSNGIYWAATETSTEFYAYMEGGLRSGERAANQLIDELTAIVD